MRNWDRLWRLMLPAALILMILGTAVASWGVTPQIAAGANHTVRLRSDGTLWASGSNASGQLGDGSLNGSSSPVQIGTESDWAAVATGDAHNLALKADGSLWAWGDNGSGQLGIASGAPRSSVPVRVGTGRSWVAVAAGGESSFALKADGTLWAWGKNDLGQLGNGDSVEQSKPVQVVNPGTSRYAAVATDGEYTLALQADGSLWGWGGNQAIQKIAQEAAVTSASSTPVQIGTDNDWTVVSAGGGHSLALKADGTLWAWGLNSFGQLGIGVTDDAPTPNPAIVQVGTDRDWLALSAGNLHTLAVKRDGTLWVWGGNLSGQLGDGSTTTRNVPTRIAFPAGVADIVAVAAGATHSLAAKANGEVFAWGDNGAGQLGNGTTADALYPTLVGTDEITWVATEPGGTFTVALRSNGSLWTWGENAGGQLGDGTFTQQPTPAMVGEATNWVAQAAGLSHTVALRADGTLWTWGANASGQLGGGTTNNRPFPQQITADNWTSVAAGDSHTLALKADGTLWAWGDNGSGQLGVGSGTSGSDVPMQIVTGNPGNFDNRWVAVAAGGSHSLALQADGTLWVWGDNSLGQLGDPAMGDTLPSNIPQQVVNLAPPTSGFNSSWVAVAAGLSHSLALQADGTLWAWGSNFSGQLGNGDAMLPRPADQPVPVQVLNPGASPYVAMAAGDSYSFARQADGSLWSWGNNTGGQLGIGTTDPDPLNPVPHPTPVREGTAATNWVAVGTGGSHTAALKAAGSLWTWGSNVGGQLGDGTLADRPISAPLSGARISVAPQSISFGAVTVGTVTLKKQKITIGNTGTAPLSVTSLILSGADKMMFITEKGTCGATPFNLAAGGNCTVEAAFRPAAPAGRKGATMTVASNDPELSAVTVNLSGTAVVPFTVTAAVAAGSPAGSGTITPSGEVAVLPGAGQSFTITPNIGFHVVDVKVDGVSKGSVTTLTLPSVTANQTVTASFAANAAAPDGDVNNDGRVDVSDALKALQIAVGLDTPTPAEIVRCDVAPLDAGGMPSPDKKVTAADALLILKKAIGLVSGW